MVRRRPITCGSLVLAAGLLAPVAGAQGLPPGGAGRALASAGAAAPPEAAAAAAFRRALAAYEEGRYAEAEAELQRAVALDPKGKDLLFNLALVQEKRGRLREAVATLDRLIPLERDAAERAGLERTRRRLVGAQREAPAPPAPAASAADGEEGGGASGWVVGGVVTAVAATLVGAYFGWRALDEQPRATAATGPTRSAAQLRAEHASAHRYAVLADVAFAVAVVSGGTALVLRATTPAPRSGTGTSLHAGWQGRF